MPHIFQPTTIKPIPEHAKPFKRDKKDWVRWQPYRATTTGEEWIEAEVIAAGKCRVTSPNWWVKWVDSRGENRKELVGPDRREAELRAAQIVQQLYAERTGASQSPLLLDHLTIHDLAGEYRRHLEALDRAPRYCAEVERQIREVATACGWTSVRTITHDGWVRWVGRVRGPAPEGKSNNTINHYLLALRGLINWLIKSNRLASDPLKAAQHLNIKTDCRLTRRAISPTEFRRLIDSTRASDKTWVKLDGFSRAALYLIAGRTGLRAGTLATMTKDDLRLVDDTPHVTIDAKRMKSKRDISIPLSPETIIELQPWLNTRQPGQLLWPGNWYSNSDAATILRRDLEAAAIPADTPDGTFDFHALRSQCGTDLARAGVPLTVVQKILGHSKAELTAKFYSRHGLDDLADAVGKVSREEPKKKHKKKR